jgi:hypothetical protein
MLRALVLAALAPVFLGLAVLQAPLSVLHIKVALMDAERHALTPIARHALLISDNPATSSPRRVVTALDGTVDVRLRPGSYTVESDDPAVFQGKSYQWTRTLTVAAGRDTVLELTAENAEIGTASVSSSSTPTSSGSDLSSLLARWQDSVVALWTPTTHASGFVVGANGLIATSQRAIAGATSAEVQVSDDVKVAGRIVSTDPDRDVALLWVDPKATAGLRPVPLGCDQAAPQVKEQQDIITIGAPMRLQKGPAFGVIGAVSAKALTADVILPGGSVGGPVFTADGGVIGMTSILDDKAEERRGNARVVRASELCGALAAAALKAAGAAPDGLHLPVEPMATIQPEALKEMAQRRVGSLNPYQTSSLDFEIAFITPLQIYGAQVLQEQMAARSRSSSTSSGTRTTVPEPAPVSRLLEFGNWSEYMVDVPPVLVVRVTPKMVEGFWTKVARGAAQTQGVALPAFKRAKSGFQRMRAFCGDTEVQPIHPFKLEQHVSETDVLYEGLYIFDPGALGPSCASVKLTIYSEKEPDKPDTRVVDPKVVQQIWQDFAPYRK